MVTKLTFQGRVDLFVGVRELFVDEININIVDKQPKFETFCVWPQPTTDTHNCTNLPTQGLRPALNSSFQPFLSCSDSTVKF